mgnify:CR=1 FL=1
MVTLDMIRKPVEGDLEAFEQFIRQKFTADGTLLSEMLDYALSARGKGIRPMTVLLSAALNAPAGQRSGGLRTLLAATLVEMIHVASLIHDDVIDESDMRRGRASVNARWQSRNAVVVGDYILAKNMDLGLKSGQFDLVTHVCGAIATLCEGEILQNDKANRQEMTRASYLDIIYKKTACLIGVSASAGALAVGASREKQALIGQDWFQLILQCLRLSNHNITKLFLKFFIHRIRCKLIVSAFVIDCQHIPKPSGNSKRNCGLSFVRFSLYCQIGFPPRRIWRMLFSALLRGIISSCPQPVQRRRKSMPLRSTSHCFAPQGCSFFMTRISLTCTSMAYLLFFPCLHILEQELGGIL